MQLFIAEATIFFKKKKNCPWKHKKLSSKVAYFSVRIFFSTANRLQISVSVPYKLPTARLMYNDFVHRLFCLFLLRRAVDSTKPTKKLVMILGKMKMVVVILWILIRHFSSFGKRKKFFKMVNSCELFYFCRI